jgi:hypothetical protein
MVFADLQTFYQIWYFRFELAKEFLRKTTKANDNSDQTNQNKK